MEGPEFRKHREQAINLAPDREEPVADGRFRSPSRILEPSGKLPPLGPGGVAQDDLGAFEIQEPGFADVL